MEKKETTQKKRHPFRFLFRFIAKLAIIVGIGYVVLTYVMGVYRMTGNAMFPAVKDGDLCITYKLDELHLNDVVFYNDEKGNRHMGRIVAMPGQVVDFPENGGYLVNGMAPLEEVRYETYIDPSSDVEYPVTVPDGQYFVLNDMRDSTVDSRVFGCISKSDMNGKLIFVLRRRGF